MTARTGSLTYEEEPLFFPSAGETLFGMLTVPTGPPNGIAVTLCAGGAHLTLVQRNRVFVRLARELAGLGYHVLRFDYRGTGESSGLIDRFSLDDLFEGDVEAALGLLRRRGLRRHLLLGVSFGARTALLSAASFAGVEGLVMVSPPIWDQPWGEPVAIRRALRLPLWGALGRLGWVRSVTQSGVARAGRRRVTVVARRIRHRRGERARQRSDDAWVSPGFVESLSTVVASGMPVLLLIGQDDEMYRDFVQACDGRVGRAVEAGGSRIEVVTPPGPVHGFASIGAQDLFVHTVTGWFRQFVAAPAAGSGSGRGPIEDGQRPAPALDDGEHRDSQQGRRDGGHG